MRRKTSVKRTASKFIGAREAERMLGISRSLLHTLANSGRLPGRLVDKRGSVRHWVFDMADVQRMKRQGTAIRQVHRRRPERIAWEQHYGKIPSGYTVAFRNGNDTNTAPQNLCLVPLKALSRLRRNLHSRQQRTQRIPWTRERLDIVRRRFATEPSESLAKELGIAKATLNRRARLLGLRKKSAYLIERAKEANSLPVGTERVKKHNEIVWVKVGTEGTYTDQWRPKHHIAWEQANGRQVPRGYCIVFKDQNNRNFDPENLYLATKKEIASIGFAEYLKYPSPLRDAIRLSNKLRREVDLRRAGTDDEPMKRTGRRKSAQTKRWTPEMDQALRRDYPVKPIPHLLTTIGVSLRSLRNRARRLGVRRSPQTIIAEAQAAAAIEKARALA